MLPREFGDDMEDEDDLSCMSSDEGEETDSGAPKVYKCDHPGCRKKYSKPCRLEEHIRVHTGEV